MKLKSYYSETVEAAMELARTELGDDALLINARPASPETRYLGEYEVVFGLVEDSGQAFASPPERSSGWEGTREAVRRPEVTGSNAAPAFPGQTAHPFNAPGQTNVSLPPPQDVLASEVAELRRQVSRLLQIQTAEQASNLAVKSAADSIAPEHLVTGNLEALRGEEVEATLASQIASGAGLEQIFRLSPELGAPGSTSRIVTLVGPPGVGKTTTLIKLAVRYGLARAVPVRIVNTDVHRIAAAEQLLSIAAILEIRCDVARTAASLDQLLKPQASGELVLIDTPGYASGDFDTAETTADVLAANSSIDMHLVLSAGSKSSDLVSSLRRFQRFSPRKLIFTRLDETEHHGPWMSAASEANLPISFLCSGRKIPDDLEEASLHRFSELLHLPEDRQRVAAPNQQHRKANQMAAKAGV